MEKFKLILLVLLPSTLCVLLSHIIKTPLEYSTLTFGFIIGVTNWNFYKSNPFLGVLLSMSFSFASFLLAYFSLFITLPVFSSFAGEKGGIIGSNLSMYVIAPLCMFYLFKFIFKMKNKTKLTIFIISFSIGLLILQSYLFVMFPLVETNILNPQSMWQIIMALALQLILYQKELKNIFKSKNPI